MNWIELLKIHSIIHISVNYCELMWVQLTSFRRVNADILKLLKRSRYKIIIIEFINDISILIYKINTKNIYKVLKKFHVECELWTRWYKTRCTLIKYELIHLTKDHWRFNITIIININKIIKKSFISMKMLKMQFDIKFKWDSHFKKIHKKIIT
jgi:hypothetical protein